MIGGGVSLLLLCVSSRHVPLHARGPGCALASAVAAVMAAARQRDAARAYCTASASPARVQWALDNMAASFRPRIAAMHRFASAVAFYAAVHSSAATRCFLAVIFAVINLSRTISCTCRVSNRRPGRVALRRSLISTRSRLHLLNAARVRSGYLRILKPDTKNESTTNTRLNHPSVSPPPWPSEAS